MCRERARTGDELVLGDGEQGERELRALHLLRGVLVSALEARQAADAHHHEAVAALELDARGLRGDLHADLEARLHHVDRRLVRRVQAGHHALRDDPLGRLDAQLALRDRAVGGEHRGGDAEAEVGLHFFCLLPANG